MSYAPKDPIAKLKSRFSTPFSSTPSSSHAAANPPARAPSAGPSRARDSGVGLVDGVEQEWKVWNVLWREPQQRKNKSWEHDGLLVMRGTFGTLRNEDGKIMGQGQITASLFYDEECKIGGKDCKIQDPMPYADYLAHFGPPPSSALNVTPNPSLAPPQRTAPPTQRVQVPHAVSRFKPLVVRPSQKIEPAKERDVEMENSPPPRKAEKRPRSESMESERMESPRPSQRRGVESDPAGGDEDAEMEVKAVKVDKGNGKEVQKTRGLVPMVRPGAVEAVVEESHYYLCQWRKQSQKKKPTWEGDGVLAIVGRKATLKDKETGKDIAHGAASGAHFMSGDPVVVGNKVVEIESEIDEQDYLDGKPFIKSALPPALATSSFYIPAMKRKRPTAPIMTKFSYSAPGKPKEPVSRFPADAEGAIVMTRPNKEHEDKFNAKSRFAVVDVVIDPIISGRLRAHQVEGVKFMYECVMGMKSEGQGCILADEMGLGKTIQAITLIYTLLKQSPYFDKGTESVIERALIVCPVTLVKNWETEIRKWLGRDRVRVFAADSKSKIQSFTVSKSYNILIIGYEKLRTVIDEIKSAQPPIGLIICDEGHRLKSSGAQISKALKQLSTPRRVILSGTPIQNDLSEFHSMVDFVNPGALDTYSVFKKVFETVILKSREPKASAKDRKVGTARSEQLARVSKTFILRRTGEVIQKYLPPKLEYTVFIVPTQLELALYARILEGNAVKDLLSGSSAQQLSLLTVLRMLCNTPGLLMEQVKASKASEVLNESVTSLLPPLESDSANFALSGKLLVVGSLLKALYDQGEEKIVVVSNFTTTLNIIEKHCKAKKYPFCRLDGKTPQSERIPMVEGFNKGPLKNNFVFLLSSKSGGTGLNIIGASRLVLIDSDWNPSTDLQAMARIHREGQKKQCVIYRFLTAGTMDEKIFQRQITKLGLSGSLMDTEAESSGAKGDAFTLDDLKSIFKLHTGVACQTHDLLGCRCHLDEPIVEMPPKGEFDSDSEEEDDPPSGDEEMRGFMQASQMRDESPVENTKDRRNLSVLKEWLHHNCVDEAAVDDIEDEVLRALVYTRVADAQEKGGFEPPGGGVRLKGGRIGFAFAKKSSVAVE